jgi:hypothetical protein
MKSGDALNDVHLAQVLTYSLRAAFAVMAFYVY